MTATTRQPLFFCSGLKRSGSTWSYNVCRLLLQGAYGNIHAGYVGEGDSIDNFISNALIDRPVLLKFHYPSRLAYEQVSSGRAKNVYTWRHPLDAIASEMDFFDYGFETALNNIHVGLQHMDNWKSMPGTLFVAFDDLTDDPAGQIGSIAQHLGIDIGDEAIRNIDRETSMEASRKRSEEIRTWEDNRVIKTGGLTFDPVTLLHADGHASKGRERNWQDTLSREQEAVARQRLAAWLDD